MDMEASSFKSGYVSIIGKTNVGKSTLLNQLLGLKLSIVTPKPQTTRRRVIGILNGDGYQIVFIDTPGIIEPRYTLQEVMMRYVKMAMEDADIILYMVDVSMDKSLKDVGEGLRQLYKPVILLLNKIDLIQKDSLLPLIDRYNKVYPFDAIIPISAIKGDGLERVVNELTRLLPEGHPYYPTDYITPTEERFFVSEIIREKVFLLYGEEVPYSIHVEIEEFKERQKGKDYIRAIIYVERESQKGILIGKGGEALKRVGKEARQEIEGFLGRPVFLELFVKVSENWRKKEARLREFGY
ncbi:MAG: GTPase Era [Thermodesulfovibrionia bacterium]